MLTKLIFLAALSVLSNQLSAADASLQPNSIETLAANKPQLSVHAKGDQIYLCTLDAKAYIWKWQAPDAKLFDADKQTLVGSHGAGPAWKLQDGSSVKAKMLQKVDSPDSSAIPWLLLEVTEHKGQGALAQVAYILRINTEGGMPPTSGCDENHMGTEMRVPYSADYNFFNS